MRTGYSSLVKTAVLIAAGLGLLIIFMFRPLRESVSRLCMDFFYPYLKAPSAADQKAGKGSLYLKSKITLVNDIEKLKANNLKLAAKAAEGSIFEGENRQLRAMLRLQNRRSFTPVPASIITRDPVSWDEVFVIDKGSDDGVTAGALVLAPAPYMDTRFSEAAALSVVGRVKTVSSRSAIVASVLGENCKISVRLPVSSTAGIVSSGKRKENQYFLKITYLPKEVTYKKGEVIFTSGFSESTPAAFFVGILSDESDITVKDNLYKEAFILSPINFGELDFVVVMVKDKK